MLVRSIEAIGRGAAGIRSSFLGAIEEIGRAVHIGGGGLLNLFRRPLRLRLIVQQMESIGVNSLGIIVLTSAFTGAVFTVQSHRAFALFGAEAMVGGTVGVALTRELGPTLTGLLVCGRAGSAIAAELGSMRVTEQIDALDAMAVDPVNYLVKPRLIASILVMPMLTAVFDFVGIGGSYIVGIYQMHMSEPEFMIRLQDWVDWDDIWTGLLKSVAFGFIMGTVACYKGFYTRGGAKGVGDSTTSAVVVASVMILITNFFLTVVLP